MATVVPVEQFRTTLSVYVPEGYPVSYLDLVAPKAAAVTLDGKPLTLARSPIGASTWSYARTPMTPGVHHLATTDDHGMSATVAGFGYATSFYYSAGQNLKLLSSPPVIIVN